MNLTLQFKVDALRYCTMLHQLDEVTKLLQTGKVTRSKCKIFLDSIAESIDEEKSNLESNLFKCQLENRAISTLSTLLTY